MQYEEALRTAGYTALDEALREMAAADNPCLEVSEHSLTLGKTKLYITEITRFRLVRCATCDCCQALSCFQGQCCTSETELSDPVSCKTPECGWSS